MPLKPAPLAYKGLLPIGWWVVFVPRSCLFFFVFVRFCVAFLFAFAYNVLVVVRSSFLFPWVFAVSAPFLCSPARGGGVRFAPSFSLLSPVLPSVAVASAWACRFGASGFSLRPSARALGGFVAVASFRRCWSAFRFARFVAPLLPGRCRGVVARVAGPSGRCVVSVPVCASSVPAAVLAGGSLSLAGSPPAVRLAFLASAAWRPAPPPVRPAPGSRRLAFAAFFALGWAFPAPRPVPVAVSARVAAAPAVAFCGSRRVAPPAPLLAAVAGAVPAGVPVLVGCVGGLCAAVRSRFPFARVFAASAFGSGASAFARRSVALVRAAAAAGAVWLSFPAAACPPGLVPSSVSRRCFSGSGSGSWASLCFAVGLGVPAFVWLPPGCPAPSWLVPLGGGWFRAVRPSPPVPVPLLPGFC